MNNSQLENLLKITASRLGTTPEALKAAAESGQLNSVLGNAQGAERLQQVLSNPEEAKKLLSSPQAKRLLDLLGK